MCGVLQRCFCVIIECVFHLIVSTEALTAVTCLQPNMSLHWTILMIAFKQSTLLFEPSPLRKCSYYQLLKRVSLSAAFSIPHLPSPPPTRSVLSSSLSDPILSIKVCTFHVLIFVFFLWFDHFNRSIPNQDF